jgi:16S rRNA (guanine(527)-N(7))-methyltransferase RsmG
MSATLSNHPLPRRSDLWQSSLGWQPSDPQWALLEQLYQGILDGNRQINLTRLTQPDDFWEKHLWDSFSGLWPWLVPDAARDWTVPPVDRVIDIGTGAGFPGFPAAIAQPQWQVTLLDSTQKKVRFLAELATELGLEQVQAIADRAEFLGHQPAHREQYDLALLRAVGGPPPVLNMACPWSKSAVWRCCIGASGQRRKPKPCGGRRVSWGPVFSPPKPGRHPSPRASATAFIYGKTSPRLMPSPAPWAFPLNSRCNPQSVRPLRWGVRV